MHLVSVKRRRRDLELPTLVGDRGDLDAVSERRLRHRMSAAGRQRSAKAAGAGYVGRCDCDFTGVAVTATLSQRSAVMADYSNAAVIPQDSRRSPLAALSAICLRELIVIGHYSSGNLALGERDE